ncbi:hypothetical protein BST27_18550 [Mycobacterium intermedium]|uniref:Uncharacterized protein n=1 Tax=Mycobacterium intermedium TaxID=28445 RepID=A0A1E3SGH8_MYCIE|nr:hypothetical protein BHQ20_11850 [Mycobacterium intermedium]OPE52296.1 hypothetical protein BV508_02830 [Mycobacterium intermedium]ORB00264.1 hypothetical protein BST27_18550 [Mycobacterium intermedium]
MSLAQLQAIQANIRSTRSSIGADKSRGKTDDDPTVARKYQTLGALQLERAVRTVLDGAHRPSDEQLSRIAALLTAGGGR